MHAAGPIQPLDAPALDADGRTRRAVGVDDAVEQARAARGAEVAVHGAAAAAVLPLRAPRPPRQPAREVGREREQARGREDGRRAEGRRRLLLALGAVAVEQREGLRRRRRERDAAALAPHCERLGIRRRGHRVKGFPSILVRFENAIESRIDVAALFVSKCLGGM